MNDTPNPAEPHTNRRRRALWVVAAVIAVVSLGVIAIFRAKAERERREWEAACAEADQLDPGWRLADLTARPAPPGPDAVAAAVAAARLLKAALPQYQADRDAEREVSATHPNRRLTPEATAVLRAWLTAAAPALTEAVRLADCTGGRVNLPDRWSEDVASQSPNCYAILDVCKRLLYRRLLVQLEVGDTDAALSSVRAIVNASRPHTEAPSLLNALAAHAMLVFATNGVERTLARGEPSPAALDATYRLLEAEAGRSLLLNGFRGERAGIEEILQALADGRVSAADVAEAGPLSAGRSWTGRRKTDRWLNRHIGGVHTESAAPAVRHLNWVIERLKESPDGLEVAAPEWAARRAALPAGGRVYADTLSLYAKDARHEVAWLRCTVAALAAERFRQEKGRWPAALGELVPQYLAAVPRDPFDLQPLRLAARADGITIYSVGEDGTDDGGAITTNRQPNTDEGVRLWDVAHRNLPPLPPPPPRTRK